MNWLLLRKSIPTPDLTVCICERKGEATIASPWYYEALTSNIRPFGAFFLLTVLVLNITILFRLLPVTG